MLLPRGRVEKGLPGIGRHHELSHKITPSRKCLLLNTTQSRNHRALQLEGTLRGHQSREEAEAREEATCPRACSAQH